MATKVYGIYGRTTVEINLPVGKATLPLVFERGCLDRKNFRPATYVTSKEAIQAMIENSALYGSTIRLVKVYGNEAASAPAAAVKKSEKPKTVKAAEAAQTEAAAEPAEASGQKDYPEVTTKEEAYAILKSLGAKAVELKDTASFKATMDKYGVTFSNFTF